MSNDQNKKSTKAKSNEEIFAEFQSMRNEQRSLVSHLGTLENDLKEHKSVVDTLKTVDLDRKCFRLIGGVLCERTVKDVLPQLEETRDKLDKLIESVTEQLTKKGQEINKYRDEHNIRFRGENSLAENVEPEPVKVDDQSNRNVLVVNN